MKKLILFMIFATMFIACADNNVCVAPEYTQPGQDTTDTTSYELLIGGMCSDMNVQSIGTLTGKSDTDVFTLNWLNKCLDSGKLYAESMSYTDDIYKLDQIVTILMDNLSFDSNMVNSLFTEANNSGSIVYIYNTNSGLNFLYIRRI